MSTTELPRDYSMAEVADALGMSERWIRMQVKNGAEHERRGNRIKFTYAQVEKLRTANTKGAVPTSVTTGRKRRSS